MHYPLVGTEVSDSKVATAAYILIVCSVIIYKTFPNPTLMFFYYKIIE